MDMSPSSDWLVQISTYSIHIVEGIARGYGFATWPQKILCLEVDTSASFDWLVQISTDQIHIVHIARGYGCATWQWKILCIEDIDNVPTHS